MDINKIASTKAGLEYLTECTLATVDDLCMAKSPSKSEFRRQVSIAQTGIDCIKKFQTAEETQKVKNRVATVINTHDGSVAKYATELRNRWHPEKPIGFNVN